MTAQPAENTPSIIERAKSIILHPTTEWPRIAAEDTTTREVMTGYVVPLALIGPVCGTIGTLVFGAGVLGTGPLVEVYRPSPLSAVIGAVVAFALTLISFLVLTLIADWLSPRFGGQNRSEAAFKLVAYSATPALLAGVFSLVPHLNILGIVAFYGLYLIYTGATPMLGLPKDKAAGYTAVLVLLAFLLNLGVAAAVAANMALLAGMGLLS